MRERRIYATRFTNVKRRELITSVFTNRTHRDAVRPGIDLSRIRDASSMAEMAVSKNCRRQLHLDAARRDSINI